MTMMTTRHQMFVLALAAGLFVAGATIAAAQDVPERLMVRSREASTSLEHATLAREFRLQAEAFQARAVEQEALAARLARNASGIIHKWPSMAPKALSEAKANALAARRSARESLALADRHVRLSVEQRAAE